MFLLLRPELPATPQDLAAAVDEGLRTFVSRPTPMVTISGEQISSLDSISVDLSGATAESWRTPPRPQLGNAEPALTVATLSVTAEPISLFDANVSFQLEANEAQFQQAKQGDDELLLILHRAKDGHVRFEAPRADLEQLIKRAAGKLARKQGVTIEDVQLDLAQTEPGVLDATVTVAARKLLFRPVLKLSGRAAIDDQLVATISNLKCNGDGPIAALACAAITPQFARIENRPLALSALPMGEIRLRDVAVELAGDRVRLAARFGEEPTRAG